MAFFDRAATLALRPLSFRATGLASGYAVALVNPADGLRVPATAAALELLVSSTSALNTDIQLQVSTVDTFGTTVYSNTLTDRADGAVGVTVAGLVNGTKYYWRARAAETGTAGWSAWAPVWSFTVDTNAGKAFLYSDLNIAPAGVLYASGVGYVESNLAPVDRSGVGFGYSDFNVGFPVVLSSVGLGYGHYGDVSTDPPGPHVWFLRPAAGRDGDGIGIYCFGVGDTVGTYSGSVELFYAGAGWVAVPVVSWQTFPPGPEAYTAARKLDPSIPHIDMQHSVIEIVVPAGSVPPGYPVRVRTVTP